MDSQIVISGLGGQGVLFVTGLLARACMDGGQKVLTSETHGMAQRGGTVISHLKLGAFNSPLIRPGYADLLIALKQENYDQHQGYLREDGKAVVNSPGLFAENQEGRIHTMDADSLAGLEQSPGSVNLFMLGGAIALLPVCPLEQIVKMIDRRLVNKNRTLREKALKAVEIGFTTLTDGLKP